MTNPKQNPTPKLEEARRRWGMALVLTGHPKTKTPPPAAPAVAANPMRRAA